MRAVIELQQGFLSALRGQGACNHPMFIDGHGLGSSGLSIYIHAYRARLREALESDHAKLRHYLGDVTWERLCDGYIDAHPSRYRSLRHFGDTLPDYLRQALPFSSHPVLSELARFERALLDSFDAADAPLASWSEIAARPPPEWPALKMAFHPSLHRLSFGWNSVEIWQSLKDESVPPPARTVEAAAWALWRDGDRVTRFRSMAPEEVAALNHFADGGDFSEFCTMLSTRHEADTVPLRALEYLQRWTQAGWIVR